MRTFLYLHTGDVSAARHFYSDLLGLDEIVASDGVVGYRVGSLQLTIAKHDEVGDLGEAGASGIGSWSQQLGWSGGESALPSWGFEVADDAFSGVIERIRAAAVPSWNDEPVWVGYWSLPVRDPMGHTVEVSAAGNASWRPARAQ